MRRDVIEQLRPLAGGWAPEIGERAGYKCEYCDKDMLASVDDYCSWEGDHIIPKSAGGDDPSVIPNIPKSADGGDDPPESLALSCRTCNAIKLDWNPAKEVKENPSRKKLIAVARNHLKKRRSDYRDNLLKFREIVGWEGATDD